jgi:hypothetical protein
MPSAGNFASDSITLVPPARGLHLTRRADALALRTRAAMGLPTDEVVVMSGHQAQLWHAGIAAKAFAAQHIAQHHAGAAAWITVDQDAADTVGIPYPTHALVRATWHWTRQPLSASEQQQSIGTLAASAPSSPLPGDAHPLAQAGLRAMQQHLMAHQHVTGLAQQLSLAAFDPLLTAESAFALPPQLFATKLSSTDIFARVIDAMMADPGACCDAYNAAVTNEPAARLRSLIKSAQHIELPLWRVEAGSPRRAVFAHQLASIPFSQLAPRALLMTALLRAAACDLFIHGTGGGVYDRATDAWWRAWAASNSNIHALGELAPTVVVTATRTIPFHDVAVPSLDEIQAAQQQAHRIRHDLSLMGDAPGEVERREFAARIAAETSRIKRRELYANMHAMIARARDRHAALLASASHAAQAAIAHRARSQVVFDRTWPCALLPAAALQTLFQQMQARVHKALGQA